MTTTIEVGIIPPATLTEYRVFALEQLGRGFSWDRLRFMARRIAGGSEKHPANRVAEEFLAAIPESLDRLFERVSRSELAEFREMAVVRMAKMLEEYLS